MPKSRNRKNHKQKVQNFHNRRIHKARKKLLESGLLDKLSDEYTKDYLKEKLGISGKEEEVSEVQDNNETKQD